MITDRDAFFREYVNKSDKGLEIGPSYRPIFPKREGYNVKIIDKYTKDEIIMIYDVSHLKDNIEDVDYIHEGSDLLSIFDTGEYGSYDYIASSHNLEHLDNPVQFFLECQKLLKTSGLLLLSVLDKRFCFDFFRSITTLKDVLNKFCHSNNDLDFINYLECNIETCKLENCYEWSCQYQNPKFQLTCPDTYVNSLNFYALMHQNSLFRGKLQSHQDYHKWVFSPASFAYILRCLSVIKVIDYNIEYIDVGYGPAIHAVLRKVSTVPPFTSNERLGYLSAIMCDMKFCIDFLMHSENMRSEIGQIDDPILKKLFLLSSQASC